jgi:kinesin family member 11
MVKKVILKEYCAEIEALRQQLQITREKNGIYLDPVQYEQMENKLSTQEQQLIECEGALKSRKEEIKELRTEVDTLQVELDTVRADYQDTSAKLIETEENLIETQKTVNYLQVEWNASETVVQEQISTENMLTHEVKDLQDLVSSQDTDLKGLFQKIQNYKMKEEERLQEISTHILETNSRQENIKNCLETTLQSTSTQSVTLCDDISTLLIKGKEVNLILKNSINTALTVLINETTNTKEKMMSSCDELKAQLGGTQVEVIESLSTLQSTLSQWLNDVERNMIQTQSHLSTQQQQLKTVMTTLSNSSEQYMKLNTSFLTQQQQQTSSLQLSLHEMKNDLLKTFQSYEKEQEEASERHEREMNEKSDEIQRTMIGMLNEMMNTKKIYLNETKTTMNTMISTLTQQQTTSFQQHSNELEKIQQNIMVSSEGMLQTMTSTVDTTRQTIHQTMKTGQEIDTIVTQISSTAGNKRQNLDETLGEVSERISSSISSGD